jgi:cysteine dioxygenase
MLKASQLLLVWRPESESCIHDHTAHCCMKILKGRLKETLYNWPNQTLIESGLNAPPEVKGETCMNENDVGYISSKLPSGTLSFIPYRSKDKIGLHRMINVDSEWAVSLHRKSPYGIP